MMLRKVLRAAAHIYFKMLEGAVDRINKLQMALYSSPDRLLRRVLSPPLSLLHRVVHLFSRGLRLDVFILNGIEASTGEPICAACLMRRRTMEYFRATIFDPGKVKTQARGSIFFWQARRQAVALAQQADLLIVERNALLKWTPDEGEWVITPHRVRMVIDFDPSESWDHIEHSLKKQSQNIKRVKRAGFDYRISHDEADFDFFYKHIYIPTLRARHGDFQVVEQKSVLMPDFEQGFLMLVNDAEGNVVGGSLCTIKGDLLIGLVLGVAYGSKTLLEKGAMSAVYYLILRYCQENNIRRCDAGPVFPFADNGAYLHKRRWGFYPSADLMWQTEWLVWAPGGSRAGLNWMAAHPFIPEFARCGGKSMGSLYTHLAARPTEAVEA